MIDRLCYIAGALLLVHLAYRAAAFIHLYFIRTSFISKYQRPKAYALVTGATDGIGLELVRSLLKRNFNVLLHSRSEEKLARVCKELGAEFPGRTLEWVAADGRTPETAVPKVAGAVGKVEGRGGKFTVLINCLGGTNFFGQPTYTFFQDASLDKITAMINLNAVFPVQLTKVLMPSLSHPACVINLGSYAGVYPIPMVMTYGSSKALLHHFSRALAAEVAITKLPLEVVGIMIGAVLTTGQGGDHTSFTVIDPVTMAENVLDRVGCGYDLVCGNWRHCVSGEALKWMPAGVVRAVLRGEIGELAEREQKKAEKAR